MWEIPTRINPSPIINWLCRVGSETTVGRWRPVGDTFGPGWCGHMFATSFGSELESGNNWRCAFWEKVAKLWKWKMQQKKFEKHWCLIKQGTLCCGQTIMGGFAPLVISGHRAADSEGRKGRWASSFESREKCVQKKMTGWVCVELVTTALPIEEMPTVSTLRTCQMPGDSFKV